MTAQETRSTDWYSYTSSTQTMRTWVRRLKSYDDVPQAFRSAFPEQGASFPYTLFLPEDRLSLFNKRNAKLLCLYDERFLLLEAKRDGVTTFSSPFGEILCIEQGKILLNSWLKITSLSGTVSIKYNTTNSQLLEPLIGNARQSMSAPPAHNKETDDDHERSKLNYLSPLNYKFMNYSRQSLFPSDPVRQILYQPERCIYEGISFLKKNMFKRFATSHLAILTEREVILIKESKAAKSEKSVLYGGIFSYIPRRQIQDITFTPDPENTCCTMEISLPKNIRLQSEFSLGSEELNAFKKEFRKSFISAILK